MVRQHKFPLINGGGDRTRLSHAKLNVVVENDFFDVRVAVMMELEMPPEENDLVRPDMDIILAVHEFYGQLPVTLRYREPYLHGHFFFHSVCPQDDKTGRRVKAIIIPILQPIRAARFDILKRRLESVESTMKAFSDPWLEAGWNSMFTPQVWYPAGQKLPDWLLMGCLTKGIALLPMPEKYGDR